MMGTKVRTFSPVPHDISLEDLVPEDNFYRRLEARLDLSFVRDLVWPLYARGGRPSVDPVVFFKLQLVMFFEDIRSERQLMGIVSDRLSLRWYLGYDLFEPLPDHSSLTRIRERFGTGVFRRFFERIVEMCVEGGLVRGEELFFDATKVEANAAVESLGPRWAVEAHLQLLFGGEASEGGTPTAPPTARDEGLTEANAAVKDWISRDGAQDRSFTSGYRRRTSDSRASSTDPDATPMTWGRPGRKLGYQTHYVVDGGKARVILNALVTPSEVNENRPMLDLLWRTCFRWRLRPHHATADAMYGTRQNVAPWRGAACAPTSVCPPASSPTRGTSRWASFATTRRRTPTHVPQTSRCPSGRRTPRASGGLQGRRQNLQRLRAEERMHRLGEGPHRLASLRRGLLRQAARLPNPRGLPEGPAKEEGVGGAAVRGGQAVARDGPLPPEDAGEGEPGGADGRLRSEPRAPARRRERRSASATDGVCSGRGMRRPTSGPRPPDSPGNSLPPRLSETFFNTLDRFRDSISRGPIRGLRLFVR